MALFQTSVLKTYLAQQDNSVVERAYKKYTKYFHNATIQENIKNSKEEQYQAKFLDELFVNVLDYTLNPKPNFNITTEFKNQKGAGKADGAFRQGDADRCQAAPRFHRQCAAAFRRRVHQVHLARVPRLFELRRRLTRGRTGNARARLFVENRARCLYRARLIPKF